MKIEVKKVSSTRGMEGLGYFCTLWVDGRQICEVADYGDGGTAHFAQRHRKMMDLEADLKPVRDYLAGIVATDEEWAKMEQWERDLYPDRKLYSGHEGLECYISKLVDDLQNFKRLKRLCNGRLVADLVNGKTVYWKVPDTSENRTRLNAKQLLAGEPIKAWVNDLFKGAK